MNINKNMSMDAVDCKACSPMATVTISPTLLTDREVTYRIHEHGASSYEDLYVEIEKAVKDSKEYIDLKIEEILTDIDDNKCTCNGIKYEVVYTPERTLVDYRDEEVRIMCPADTTWTKQNVGANGNANMYYIGFKAYAPDEAISFKESLSSTITDNTMYYFEGNDFAGIDEQGRKYSIVWLPVAIYDETNSTWTYYGIHSSVGKYIGWYYSVEWYNENEDIIASDCIRINLANESCYTTIEPSYINDVVETVNTYTDEQIKKITESVEDATDEDIENLFK